MSQLLRLALLASAAAAAAAGGTAACTSASAVDEDATNGIYGSWVSTDASGATGPRTVRLSLTSARTYSLEELTVSTTGATLAHAETGTFTASAGVIDWSPEQSTCPGPDATYQSAYELSGTTFSLALPGGDVIALRAVGDDDDAGAGAALTLGCFGADGGFTTSPLSAVTN